MALSEFRVSCAKLLVLNLVKHLRAFVIAHEDLKINIAGPLLDEALKRRPYRLDVYTAPLMVGEHLCYRVTDRVKGTSINPKADAMMYSSCQCPPQKDILKALREANHNCRSFYLLPLPSDAWHRD